ncbi:MAG: HAD-IIA family hydrolase [archaeon]|nr:HAD-IIA family hydrolase [archaeon]
MNDFKKKLKPEFDKKKIFIFDLDGTVYRGKELIPKVDLYISRLTELGKKVIFLTNNATKTRNSFVKKLNKMNIKCDIDQVISSGYIAVKMLYEDYNARSIFCVGTYELVELAESAGLATINNKVSSEVLFAPFLDKSISCDAVLCGMDPGLNYAKIRTAMELIARGADFFATNADKTYPEAGQVWPGAGVTLASIETCVGKSPKVIFGKPNTFGIDFIFRELNKNKPNQKYTKKDALIIGDRLETDIWQANNAGVDSLFVETGINTRNDIPQNPKSTTDHNLVPTFVLSEIGEIFNQ